MGVRLFLATFDNAAPLVLDEIGYRSETPVGRDRIHGDAAAPVVGHDEHPAGRVDCEVTGPRPACGLPVQERQTAGDPVDRIRAGRAFRRTSLPDRVQILLSGADRQKRRILNLRCQAPVP